MKIVVAPDSFKGSMTAMEAADSIEKGLRAAWTEYRFTTDEQGRKRASEAPLLEIKKIPMADGGEGTVEALLTAVNGKWMESKIHGPLMEARKARWGIIEPHEEEAFDKPLSNSVITGIIEMAAAAGLTLIPIEKRNPVETTTYGVGELILEALNEGCKRIIIGIGGSGTNDGGIGMAQALGVKFYLGNGDLLPVGEGTKLMERISRIDASAMDQRIASTSFIVACDVTSPMTGLNGATMVYGPQKGASEEQLVFLENGMKSYAEILREAFHKNIGELPGSGAAGGLGGGLMAFLGGELKAGIKIMKEHSGFAEEMKTTDLLIVGEGRTDYQTAFGKAPAGLAEEAMKLNIPVICLSGALGTGYEKLYELGMDYIGSCLVEPMSLELAMLQASELLEKEAYRIGRLIFRLMK